MSKTIEEIKTDVINEVLKNGVGNLNEFTNEVAERYAQSQTQEFKEQNTELVFVLQNIVNMLEVDAKISVESIRRVLTKYNHLNKSKMEKKTGIELIAKEREEQINKHGRTIESDVEINKGWQLSTVASVLVNQSFRSNRQRLTLMPENWDDLICLKMIQKPYKERLIIAGALIAAELDRLTSIEDVHTQDGGQEG